MELVLFALPGIATLLVYLLILCIALAVGYWLITNVMPPPFQKWALAVLVVIVAIILIYILLGAVGGGGGINLHDRR